MSEPMRVRVLSARDRRLGSEASVPSQMWVADRFAHVAKHCAEQGWLKIEGDPSQQADAMD